MRARVRPYLYILPMAACAALFVLYPFLNTLAQAFSVVNASGRVVGYAGLSNFQYMVSRPDFIIALRNTVRLAALNVPVTVLLTLGLALMCCKPRKLSGVYELMNMLPMAVSMAASAMIFKVMLSPTLGIVNHVLGLSIGWFESRETAPYAILSLTVWMGVGVNFVLLLAALRAVPQERVEAAMLDGAGALARLWHVRIPGIAGTLEYVACTNMVLAMMTSGPVLIITQGGPSRATTTLIYMMYASGYGSGDYGLAACVAVTAFLATFAVMWLSFKAERHAGDAL